MTTKPAQAMSKAEFISLVAMMMATIAFSIDAMLPALPEIGAQLSPDDINQAQLILTSFVLGMGIGTFFTGPLSDAFGRKPVIVVGALVYIVSAGVAWAAKATISDAPRSSTVISLPGDTLPTTPISAL